MSKIYQALKEMPGWGKGEKREFPEGNPILLSSEVMLEDGWIAPVEEEWPLEEKFNAYLSPPQLAIIDYKAMAKIARAHERERYIKIFDEYVNGNKSFSTVAYSLLTLRTILFQGEEIK